MVEAPEVQSVEEAVTVQAAEARARASVTVTVPTCPAMGLPGAPLPRSAAAGGVIVRPPTVTVKVTVVFGSPPLGVDEFAIAAGPAGPAAVAADATPGASARPATADAAAKT